MKISLLDNQNSPTPHSSLRGGYISSFTSAFFAACATVVGKWNLESISPLLQIALIFSIATLIMSAIYIPFKDFRQFLKISRKGWLWMSMFTGSSLFALWLFWAGIQKIDPSLGAFLNRSEVMVAILMGIIFLGERFNRLETIGALISVAGIVIMRLTLRVEYTTGFWLVLAGSFFFGLTEYFSKMTVKYVSPVIAVYLRNMIMAAVYWIVLAGMGLELSGLQKVWPGVIALAIFGPMLSRMIYMTALKRLELSKVAVISQTQPIYVILLSVSLLGQFPAPREILGGVFLLGGCLIMILGRTRKTAAPLRAIQ